MVATATIKIICGGQEKSDSATGNGPVDIVAECFDRRFHGIGLETDIIGSSAMAMIHVLNNIWHAELVKKQKNHCNTEVAQ